MSDPVSSPVQGEAVETSRYRRAAEAHLLAVESYGNLGTGVMQRIADGGSLDDVLEFVGDHMNARDHVDDELIALFGRAKAVAGSPVHEDKQPTLAWMQRTQPWTAPYSREFEASKRGHGGFSPHVVVTVTRAELIEAMARDEWARGWTLGGGRTEESDRAWGLAPDVTAVAYIERAERTAGVVLPLVADAIEERVQLAERHRSFGPMTAKDYWLGVAEGATEAARLVHNLMGADDE